MNINAIKKICMENKRVALMQNPRTGDVWISNGFAAYVADAEIDVNAENVLHLFDLADAEEKKKPFVTQSVIKDVRFWERCGVSEIEELLEDLGAVWYGGELFRALLSRDGILFIPVKYLKPVKGEDCCEFYLRRSDGGMMVAVYTDFFAAAMIMPIVGGPAEKMKESLEEITREAVMPAPAGEKKEEPEAEQVGMFEEKE